MNSELQFWPEPSHLSSGEAGLSRPAGGWTRTLAARPRRRALRQQPPPSPLQAAWRRFGVSGCLTALLCLFCFPS